MVEAGIKAFAVVVIAAGWGVMYGLPAWYVGLRGRFWRGVFYCWGLQIMVLTAEAVFIPAGLFTLFPLHKDLIFSSFPEGPSIAGAMMMGWVPGLVLSGVGWLIHRWRKRKAEDDRPTPTNTDGHGPAINEMNCIK